MVVPASSSAAPCWFPAFVELQQNRTAAGAILQQRLNSCLLGLPPDFWLDANDPENTGLLLPPNVSLLQDSLEAPEALQTSLGFTQRLGDTGLYLDVEGIYSEGDNEIVLSDTNWRGNDDPGRKSTPSTRRSINTPTRATPGTRR